LRHIPFVEAPFPIFIPYVQHPGSLAHASIAWFPQAHASGVPTLVISDNPCMRDEAIAACAWNSMEAWVLQEPTDADPNEPLERPAVCTPLVLPNNPTNILGGHDVPGVSGQSFGSQGWSRSSNRRAQGVGLGRNTGR